MSNYGEPAAPAPVSNHTELAELRAENALLRWLLAAERHERNEDARWAERDRQRLMQTNLPADHSWDGA